MTTNPARLSAQRELAGAAELHLRLERLKTVGSVLMIAAHPDDENTALLAYFARGRHLRTAYLSLTRGEGGQNLIGSEQGDLLGLIRTQELLAARRIDGAQQFFTRAIDFGFSKTADETLAKWGREQVLGDVVWVIRKFRPDAIVLRFSGTPRDGHGHHQSSAILGKEAFEAAADPQRFPEQLGNHTPLNLQPWRAKRLVWNVFAFNRQMEEESAKLPDRIEVDTGEFDPILGYSYAEIAGMSRSKHASQGFGSPETRGSAKAAMVTVEGPPVQKDLFDDVDITWRRLPGGDDVAESLEDAAEAFDPSHPEETLSALAEARPLVAKINHPDARRKLQELDEAIALCAGLWVDASADRWSAAPGDEVKVHLQAVRRLPTDVTLVSANLAGLGHTVPWKGQNLALEFNKTAALDLAWSVPANAPPSQPYWLVKPKQGALYTVDDRRLLGEPENPPVLTAHVVLRVGGAEVRLDRPVHYRYVSSVRGELTRPLIITPPLLTLSVNESVYVFPEAKSQRVEVTAQPVAAKYAAAIRPEAPAGWTVAPKSVAVGESNNTAGFEVTPPAASSTGELHAIAMNGGTRVDVGMHVIDYPHIPPQVVFPPAEAKLVRADIRTLSKNVGYLMGAGDEVPNALRQIGVDVTLLTDDQLATADLSKFDAIVTGVRAFNTREAVRNNFQRLLTYAQDGGTLVVQYNVLEGFPGRERREAVSRLGPYPIQLSRSRVTVEEAPVMFPDPNHPLLTTPNRITEKDFEGWVQERGLYFAGQFDPKYTSVFASKDPGEDWLPGGMLYTKYGKGAYVFTAYSWFRQLPAGVPGAYRIFANLISAGKVQ